MKQIVILFFVCFTLAFRLQATSYYLSAAGNDNAAGTSAATAWKTISKLNASVSYAPGDTVFFRAGDVFRGTVTINQGGNASSPVVFTSYGSGAKPVISGADSVLSWTQSGNAWRASFSSMVYNFFADGSVQMQARYPNSNQYLVLDSATTTYLRDASLTSLNANLINGSKACIHTAQWCWEKTGVASLTGDKIAYNGFTQVSGTPGFAYFLYDNITHLDTVNEWKYDSLNHYLYFIPPGGSDPNTLFCEASVRTYGFQVGMNAAYLKIDGISFAKQSDSGILFSGANNGHCMVQNCDFNMQYNHGINDKGRYNEVSNCYFREVYGIGLYVNGTGFHSYIHHNTFRNIGSVPNYGIGKEINLSAITLGLSDSCQIDHNDIDSTGYCGISADGGYHIIEKNIIRHVMRWNNDGGALKSWGANSHDIIFRNNFIEATPGNTTGVTGNIFLTPGIYFDFNVNHCLIENNTVYNQAQRGIFQNAGDHDNTIRGNIIYHFSDYGLDLNGTNLQPTAINNMNIKSNVFFPGGTSGYPYRQIDFNNTFAMGTIDSNYAWQPFNPNRIAYRIVNGSPSPLDFTGWQGAGNDLNGKDAFVNWTYPTDNSQLFMNASDTVLSVNPGNTLYLDLDSAEVCGVFQLQPWTSRVLINTGTTCNPVGRADDRFENEIQAWPNPFNDKLNLRFPESLLGKNWFLVDVFGRVLQSATIREEKTEWDAGTLSPGMYFIRAEGMSGTQLRVIRSR